MFYADTVRSLDPHTTLNKFECAHHGDIGKDTKIRDTCHRADGTEPTESPKHAHATSHLLAKRPARASGRKTVSLVFRSSRSYQRPSWGVLLWLESRYWG